MNIKSIVMIGPFPSPLTGMAFVNNAMRNHFSKNGFIVVSFNTSPPSLKVNIYHRMLRVKIIISSILRLLEIKNNQIVYISISAGLGQLYETVFILIARFKNCNIYIHHHSFEYIKQKSYLTSFLLFVSGKATINIVLSDKMREKFKYFYPRAKKIVVLSNISFVDTPIYKKTLKSKYDTIGYLGYLTEEKGIHEFINMAVELNKIGLLSLAIIAGPYISNQMKYYILELEKKYNFIQYWGKIKDDQKNKFFNTIDYFITPTKSDAEPLVIYEALSYGIPVITYNEGCIGEQIGTSKLCGKLILQNEPFMENAIPWIQERIKLPEIYRNSSNAVRIYFTRKKIIALEGLESFIKVMQNC
jgi:glycosyltransferase involved in cell wall biosynthesis